MINLFLSQTKSISYRIIWIIMLFVIPSRVFSADKLQRRCRTPFSCGDQVGLLYPFWIPGREACGHPNFKLDCNGGFAELNISSVKFRILKASYISNVIILARSDYINNLCPLYPLSAPFNESVLPLAPDTDLLTLYYNCNDLSPPNGYFRELDCGDDRGGDGRNYYVTRNLSSLFFNGISGLLNDFKAICRRNVTIPVSRQALDQVEGSPSQGNLAKALDQGFELRVNQDCPPCTQSGGACGYNHNSSRFVCYCNHGPRKDSCRYNPFSRKARSAIGLGLASVFLVAGGAGFYLSGGSCFIRNRRIDTSDDSRQQHVEALIPLKHYSYLQVKRITKSFAEVVGKGGFGTVYKGTLCDGRSVAVKILKDSNGDGEDFINEVASMSKTSHVNIVSLLGFCSEGSKAAIIYEYLENGSLDQFISRNTPMDMDWMALYGIALGVARGLEYLHHGCKTRIVHFDIKPQNILLDDNLCPKVSDFGLAKLCKKKESILSLLDARGTIGYIAPEVFSRMYGRVSHKSDVYSYGMLVLEMIGERNKQRADENSASNASSMYFPEWIYRDLEKEHNGRLNENGISSEEAEISKKMTIVGLWCIQPSPTDRPPMNRVVEMMER